MTGTEHELDKAIKSWKQNHKPDIMIYFNQKSYMPTKSDLDQQRAVLDFKEKIANEGLYFQYNGLNDFSNLVSNQLNMYLMDRFKKNDQISPTTNSSSLTSDTTDLDYHKIKSLEEEFHKFINKSVSNDTGVMLITPYTDFSGGNHECWYTGSFRDQDIKSKFDADRAINKNVIEYLKTKNDKKGLIIFGEGYLGKSVLLKRIMFEFIENGYCVLYADNFNSTEYQLRDLIRNTYENYNKLIVIVDDVHKEQNEIIFPVVDTNSNEKIKFLLAGRKNELNSNKPNIARTLKNLNSMYLTFDEKDAESFVSKAISIFPKPLLKRKNLYKVLFNLSQGDPLTFQCSLGSIILNENTGIVELLDNDNDLVLLDYNVMRNCICYDITQKFKKLEELSLKGKNVWKPFLLISILGIFGIPLHPRTNKNIIDCCEIALHQLNYLAEIGIIKKDQSDSFLVLHEIRTLEFLMYLFNERHGKNLTSFDHEYDIQKILKCLYHHLSYKEKTFIIRKSSSFVKEERIWLLIQNIATGFIDNTSKNNDQPNHSDSELSELYGFGVGRYYSHTGNLSKAIEYYDKAIELDHNNTNNFIFLSSKGLALDNNGKHDEALEVYEKGILINPDFETLWYNKGVAFFNLSRYQEAIKAYDTAIKLDSTDVDSFINKGRSLWFLGKVVDASKEFDKALDLDPHNVHALNNKSVYLLIIKKFNDSMVYIEKSLKVNPYNAKTWYIKAEILYEMRRYEEALKAFQMTTNFDPTIPQFWYRKGLCLHTLKQYNEAINSYNEAIKLSPKLFIAISDKGNSYMELGNLEKALENFDLAISINSKDPIIWYNKAVASYKLGKVFDAITFANNATNLVQNYFSAWMLKIICYEIIGDIQNYKNAVSILKNLNKSETFEHTYVNKHDPWVFMFQT